MTNKEVRDKKLISLADSDYGEAMRSFIDEQIAELNTINGVNTIEDVKGKEFAIATLKRIFKKIEKPEIVPQRKTGEYE